MIPKAKKLPSGSWTCRVTVDGTVHSITRPTRRECEAEAAEIKAGKAKLSGPVTITLRKALDNYIDRRELRSPSTIRGYRTIQRTRLQSIMDVPLYRITDDVAQTAINKDKVSGKTMRNAWMLIASAIREAGADVPSVILPDVVEAEHRFLSSSDIVLFLDAIRGDRNEVALLLALHGATRSEILNITYQDIDLKAGLIHIRGSAVYDEDGFFVHKNTNKNSYRRRDVPIMIPRLRELLEDADGEPGEYVVTCAPNRIRIAANRACEKAGLPLIGCHGLRHSFASLALVTCGLSEDLTQRLGGWNDPGTMHKIYTHVSQEELLRATSKMSDFYEKMK